MVSWIISRTIVLLFGTLYPAYSSYKAVKTKNVKEYPIILGSAHRYHPCADSGAVKTNTCCPPKRVPSADRFFSLCRPTMQPPQSYSIGGCRGRWCTVSRGHPGRPQPSPPGRRSANCASPLGSSHPRSAVE